MHLNNDELREHANACGLATDPERQKAFHALDSRVRARLSIPDNRFYTFNPVDGLVVIDTKRDRPKPVAKISKSDQ